MAPDDGVRTVILHDVESLSPEDQQQLLVWLKTNFGSVQVVATTERPLLELVESAKFDPALYYALNVVYIKLPS
jgi:transcriptional regulator of acetoin/glycerol metabolism